MCKTAFQSLQNSKSYRKHAPQTSLEACHSISVSAIYFYYESSKFDCVEDKLSKDNMLC